MNFRELGSRNGHKARGVVEAKKGVSEVNRHQRGCRRQNPGMDICDGIGEGEVTRGHQYEGSEWVVLFRFDEIW